jgi:F-type H+-transporting ATPase subunit epsilon
VAFDLAIVTPHGQAFAAPVEHVVLPGSEGRFGVLVGHERFLTPLRAGEIEIRSPQGTRWAAVSGGFADVSESRVVVLAEACELAEQIDVARAERARRQAEADLARLRAEHADAHAFRLYEAALERALVRLQTAARAR